MFLTRSGIKKMMTQAYKGGGLRVKNDGQGYSFTGGSWSVYFLKGCIPKETLGDIISLVGELPGNHEVYTANKAGQQIELYDEGAESAMDMVKNKSGCMAKTLLVIDDGVYKLRVLKDLYTGDITTVNESMVRVVEPSLIDSEDDEELPEGPIRARGLVEETFLNAALWHNNRMAFCIGYAEPDDENINHIKKKLQKIAREVETEE